MSSYNPEKDAYQPIGRPYKTTLKKICKVTRRTEKGQVEYLIKQAGQALGITTTED